jgi:Uncharacterized proteins, LmbE homologs
MPRPGGDHEGVLGCVQMRERGGRLSTGNDVRAISLEQTDSRNSGDYVLRTGRACRIMSHGGGKVARTLLCIVPHPDDAEFSAGGFLARMSAEGVRVLLAVATDGSKGSFEPVEAVQPKHGEAPRPNLAQIRHAETCNAARVLGAEEPIFLGYEDFMLDTLPLGELREKIVYLIRKYKPDILVSQDPTWPAGSPPRPPGARLGRSGGRTLLPAATPVPRTPRGQSRTLVCGGKILLQPRPRAHQLYHRHRGHL